MPALKSSGQKPTSSSNASHQTATTGVAAGDERRYLFVPCALLAFLVVVVVGPFAGLDRHCTAIRKTSGRRLNSNDTTDTRTQSSTAGISLPPIDTLLHNSNGNIGNVQFLLDFVILGFGKCGTTSLKQWMQLRNESLYPHNYGANGSSPGGNIVQMPDYEPTWLKFGHPNLLVQNMYAYAIDEERRHQEGLLKPREKVWKGYKSPNDIRTRRSRYLLRSYWPETPVIVTVRHPVHWMVSLYNFNIEKGGKSFDPRTIFSPGKRIQGQFVSTSKGEFHALLAESGKTPLADKAELALLHPWLDQSKIAQIHQDRLPNPIFLLELSQLNDDNETRARQFERDLENFLGLPRGHLPPMPPHVRPGKNKTNSTLLAKMDICSDEFAAVLEEMVAIAKASSQWLQEYFIESPDVTVSSPDHFKELLGLWMVNPCDDPIQRRILLEL